MIQERGKKFVQWLLDALQEDVGVQQMTNLVQTKPVKEAGEGQNKMIYHLELK
jgi:hypothetical protein